MAIVRSRPPYSVVSNLYYMLNKIWQWDRSMFFLGILLLPSVVLIPLMGIYFSKLVVGAVIERAEPKQFLLLILGFSLILLLLNFIERFARNKLRWKSTLVRYRYINLCSEKVMDTDFQNVESPEGQEKMSRAIKLMDSKTPQNNLGHRVAGAQDIIDALVWLLSSIISIITYGTIISTLSPWLVLLLVVTTCISYFIEKTFTDYNFKTRKIWRPLDKKLNYLKYTLANTTKAKDVLIYNISKWMTNLFETTMNGRAEWHYRVCKKHMKTDVLSSLVSFSRDMIVFGVLIYMIVTRDMLVSDFVLYYGVLGGFSGLLLRFAQSTQGIHATSLEFCDFREFLEMPDKLNRGLGEKTEKNACEIKVENLSFSYGEGQLNVIKNLSFIISKGEKVAVVGANGAGKTTLVKLICGLYRPTAGKISIDDTDMLAFNRDEYYTQFSAVFQDIYLLPTTIAKNIAMCKTEQTDYSRVKDCLAHAGLLEKVLSLPEKENTLLIKSIYATAIELSGGEKQKLALARALYKDGSIIVLDEPTAALDPIAESQIYAKYGSLTEGKTSIFISHRLASTRFCDRIFFLSGGEITETGTHDQLMELNGQYANMFRVQSHYYKDSMEDQYERVV